MKRRSLFGLLGAAVVAAPSGRTLAQENDPLPAAPLVGSWNVSIVAGPDRPVVALTTFTAGGNVLSTNPPVRAAPAGADYRLAHVSTAHGAWMARDDGSFAFQFIYFQSDEEGRYLGTTTIDAQIAVSNDESRFEGDYAVVLRDPDGRQIGDGGGNVQATRIVAFAADPAGATPTT